MTPAPFTQPSTTNEVTFFGSFADDLGLSLHPADSTYRPAYQALNQSAIFGNRSTLIATRAQHLTTGQHHANISTPSIPIFTLCLVCLYCYILYRFSRSMGLLIKNAFSIEATITVMDNQSLDFRKMLRYGVVLFVASLSLLATLKIQTLTTINSYIVLGGTILSLTLIVSLRSLILHTITFISRDRTSMQQINQVSRYNVTVFSILFTPLTFVCILFETTQIISVIALCLFALYHTIRIYNLFKANKFSFLQWILYLCSVELFPLSLVLAVGLKSNVI